MTLFVSELFNSSIQLKLHVEREMTNGEKNRLQMTHSDLHAADAVYHAQCNSNIRTGKQMPQTVFKTPEGNFKKSKIS